jgi:hypothetical protein
MKKKLFYYLCQVSLVLQFGLQFAWAEAYGSGWYRETQFSVVYVDNISRSYLNDDVVSDTVSSISFGGGHSQKVGMSGQLVVSGYLEYSQHVDYTDLDRLATSLGFQYIYQPTAGFSSAWFDTSLNLTRLDYRDSDIREGYLMELGISLNRRLNTRTIGHFGYRYSNLEFLGKSNQQKTAGAAFDTMSNELYMGIEYEFVTGIHLYAEYGYGKGDVTSTVSRPAGWDTKYDAISKDWVFESCVWSACAPGYAYRTEADIQHFDAGVNFLIGSVTMDLSAGYFDAESDTNISYRDWQFQLGAIWNF